MATGVDKVFYITLVILSITGILLILLYFFFLKKEKTLHLNNETSGCPSYMCRATNPEGNYLPFRIVDPNSTNPEYQYQSLPSVMNTVES